MGKVKALAKINKEIKKCKICKVGKSGKAVPGEGNPDAKIIFVGEAPGRTESLTGRPFVGRSGQLLRSKIRGVGLEESEVYITSPVKYLPNKGTPSQTDITHGKKHLTTQLKIIDPKIIVLLGSVAAQGVLGKKILISKNHGKFIEEGKKRYFITIHPAAALRFPPLRKTLEDDFKKLQELISKTKQGVS